MKKRVLQFIGSFNQGGSERQAIALTRMLQNDSNFEVFAATLNRSGVLLSEIESLGLGDLPEFPLTSFYNTNFVRQARTCASYLRSNAIDIVHTHDFYTNVFGMAAASLAGVPVKIASKRETGGMRSRAQDVVEKFAYGRADAIVVNSEAVQEHLASRGIKREKLNLIYNGIDSGRFNVIASDADAFRRDLGISAEARIVTLVANLRHTVKNVPMLLRAAKNVTADLKDVHFIIAGEGELQGELQSMADTLCVADRFHFIGRCSDVPKLLAASNVCVLTSTNEGFSNSILEYMAGGKPVVATNVGGAAEVIEDGVNGYLVRSDDDRELAQRLIELLNDETKVRSFGKKGRELVNERFSETAQLSMTTELYNRLLAAER